MNVEELVVLHSSWIGMKARGYCANPRDAEDLAGETICKILSRGMRYDPSRPFKPWALTIMQNTFISWYNRRAIVLFTSMEGCDPYSESDDADGLADLGCVMEAVRACSLRSCNIECVMLSAQGYDQREISDMLGVPIGTVKSRISVGRKMLRKRLKL